MTSTKSWGHLYVNQEKRFDQPIILQAEVIHGFKRGSTELGFPTANLDMKALGEKGNNLDTGIYYGMTTLNNNKYESVISVGWNPFYKNSEKTIEAHLLHKFDDEFYGSELTVELYGYVRPEANFDSKEDLISCIESDINVSHDRLSNIEKSNGVIKD